MKPLKIPGSWILPFLLLFSFNLIAQDNHIGIWILEGYEGEKIVLELKADQTMVLDDITYQYSIEEGNIVVSDDYGIYYYPFTISNDQLALIYPDGTEVIFKRSGSFSANNKKATEAVKSPPGKQSSTGGLTGKWVYQSQEGTLTLEFLAGNRLIFNGETTAYRLADGIIQAQTDYGWQNYPYSLVGDKLSISFPEGATLSFSKTSTASIAGQKPGTDGGNRLWQLKGSLCHWSGTSSSYGEYSSFSRTERLSFDGKGNFMFGTEASYDSNTAMLYSDNPNVERGTYRIDGKRVMLHFYSGSVVEVVIYIQQNSGMITELKYGEKLYATSLCE